jgi:DNA-binding response OmpR family regulator
VSAVPTLIVEDEADVAQLIARALEPFGFAVTLVGTAQAALVHCETTPPELAIIDLGLPDRDGLDLLRELQTRYPCAVIILTGRAAVADRVLGLELGADDYLVKPFDPRELAARAKTVMRRYQAAGSGEKGAATPGAIAATNAADERQVAHFGAWRFDAATFALVRDDTEPLTLSTAEAELLLRFLRQPNRILSREQLAGVRALEAYDRSIDVRVSRLRKKLGDDPHAPKIIKTVYGAGYLFALPVTWQAAS